MSQILTFDIETEAHPLDELLRMMPEFNPDEVALGNTKDPEKIAAKIAAAEEEHRRAWIENAPLSAATSRTLAIGVYRSADDVLAIYAADGDERSEEEIIRHFWRGVQYTLKDNGSIVGFFSNKFDLPYLMRRSMMLGIEFPSPFTQTGYLRTNFIDLFDVWTMPRLFAPKSHHTCKLAFLCEVFNLPVQKMKDVSGEMFAELYRTNPAIAIEYLRRDVVSCHLLAQKMGAI